MSMFLFDPSMHVLVLSVDVAPKEPPILQQEYHTQICLVSTGRHTLNFVFMFLPDVTLKTNWHDWAFKCLAFVDHREHAV